MYDQEELPIEISERDLIAAVSGLRPELNRVSALKTLLIRGTTEKAWLLRKTITDRAAADDVRSIAAIELGRDAKSENEKVLLDALQTRLNETVLRRVAQSLGRVGSAKSFEALQKVKTKTGGKATGSVEFAKTLLSYRFGLRKNLLQTPSSKDILKFDRKKSVGFEFKKVKAKELEGSFEEVQHTIPAIRISSQTAYKFRCLKKELWLVINEELVGPEASARAYASNAIVAAVLKKDHCPEGWYIYEYIFSQPERNAGLKLFGVRPSGIATHFGNVQSSNKGAVVKLNTLNTALALPVEFEAVYDITKARLDVVTANLSTKPAKNQKRPMPPKPLKLAEPKGKV